MPKTILYIGNDFTKKSKYNSTMETLSGFLVLEGYKILRSSSKQNKFLRLLDMCFSVFKYRKKVDYILIDTFSTTAFYYTYFTSQIARFFKIKYVPILHGGDLPKRLKLSPKLSKSIFKNSYKNIAPSNYLKVEFESEGFEVTFIPNILEVKNYSFKQRNKLNPNLLWVRSFDTIYNPEMAIAVLHIVKNEFKTSKLCMIGPVKNEDVFRKTKELIKKYKLENSVEITGVLKKEDWHKKAIDFDIFINTTNVDNTPVSVMEAMALGLPVVSTNVGGLPYLIKDKKDGFLVEKGDVKNMADKILTLLKNNNQNITSKARQKVEKFDWEEIKQKWFKTLE